MVLLETLVRNIKLDFVRQDATSFARQILAIDFRSPSNCSTEMADGDDALVDYVLNGDHTRLRAASHEAIMHYKDAQGRGLLSISILHQVRSCFTQIVVHDDDGIT